MGRFSNELCVTIRGSINAQPQYLLFGQRASEEDVDGDA
jgi:hypothetical protein